MDDLLKKVGMDNKYEVVQLAIKRVRQLIKERGQKSLLDSNERLPSIVLREIMEGKLKPENLKKETETKDK